MKENGSKINWYSENYFCEGKRPKTTSITSRTTQFQQVRILPREVCMHQVSRAITHGNNSQQGPRAMEPAAWEKPLPLQLLSMHNLSLSLSSLMLPAHLCLEKGRARVLTWRESFFTFAFFLLPGGALPFFFYLQPAMA
jgi:hypothetical protein